jgi:hypothetical protein
VCALRRENRVGSIQPPCTAAKGMYLVGARKQELPGATLLGNAVDVAWKRNGGEYAWSFLRIGRVFGISSTKRRCRGCIGCEQATAKRDGRPKNASTGTGLSDVDISYDQSSCWQKFAAVPEEISSVRCREDPQSAAAWWLRSVRAAPETRSGSRPRSSLLAAPWLPEVRGKWFDFRWGGTFGFGFCGAGDPRWFWRLAALCRGRRVASQSG